MMPQHGLVPFDTRRVGLGIVRDLIQGDSLELSFLIYVLFFSTFGLDECGYVHFPALASGFTKNTLF